ncbi:hypothetical protein N7509_011835 [Penicillium cosmopolitanum]|uniref:DNA-directed RNA polymerase III subunit n=1 Tax=Penicillium cosmopolitanum TaxID=1131564 RepID=A0A9W9VGP2_9EURO|nr:uncharacterized protein N7509_011835 [Penicillium cosmopolitanum]KAJ5378716.1 hypothetical protein N7509_011835 [Penicillium cosmopolitanum]
MSRFSKGKRLPGAEFTWDADPGGQPDTAPTPLYPDYVVPLARKLSPREQSSTDYYRSLRERYHEGPYYSVIDVSSSNSKKGSSNRTNFDPFHGMPSYAGRYQKKRRTVPKIAGARAPGDYETRFFPRSLWQTIRPDFRPDAPVDGFKPAMTVAGMKRGFEDDEDEAAQSSKKGAAGGDDEEGDEDGEEGELLEGDEDAQEEISDNEFDSEDDDGGDYNAEKYFEDGGDDMDDDGLGDGGGGGEEDF